ncbi:MAG: tetratricopeptide repeat protein [bacterium]
MPGYKPLPTTVTGPEADQVRLAESSRRRGNPDAAIHLLEEALEASLELRHEIPGWLCGRLAALYRTLGRYDDEVQLLERYRESQKSEEARTRYDARLSKARTIADRKRPRDSGALESVRVSMRRPPRRGVARVAAVATVAPRSVFSDAAVSALNAALSNAASDGSKELNDALALVCAEAHANDIAVEELVALLRGASISMVQPHADAPRDSRYESALLLLLALYYKEQQD